jgi:hypothetical protein
VDWTFCPFFDDFFLCFVIEMVLPRKMMITVMENSALKEEL